MQHKSLDFFSVESHMWFTYKRHPYLWHSGSDEPQRRLAWRSHFIDGSKTKEESTLPWRPT